MTARNTALDRANAITTEMHSFTERVNDFKVEKSTEIDQSLNQTSRISPMFGSNFFSTGPRRHVRLSSTATGNATSCEPNANFSRRRSCDSHKQLTQTNNRNWAPLMCEPAVLLLERHATAVQVIPRSSAFMLARARALLEANPAYTDCSIKSRPCDLWSSIVLPMTSIRLDLLA